MCSSRGRGVFGTVRFRLTLYHAVLFGAFSLLLLLIEGRVLKSQLGSRMADGLLGDVREFEALYQEFGLEALADEFRREGETAGEENVVLLFRSSSLAVVANSDLRTWPSAALDDSTLKDLQPGEARLRTLRVSGLGCGLRLAEACTADGNYLQLGRSLERDEQLLGAFRRVFLVSTILMLLFGVSLGWVLTGRALSGVRHVADTAVRIGQTDLSSRVPDTYHGREIQDLVTAFNDMLDRIHGLVRELTEVSENIAHDLRSPLTRIRGVLETALTAREDLRDAAGLAIEECDRLVQLVNALLEIAEANAGLAEIPTQSVDVASVVREAAELFSPMAEDAGVTVAVEALGEPLLVRGDTGRIQRVLANLLDNAVKYTPPGGRVLLRGECVDGCVVVTVVDSGPGIAPGELVRVFERFYRSDSSRTAPGNGLGLPLARAIARSHGGDVTVESCVGEGSRFRIVLPCPSRPGPADASDGDGPAPGSAS